MTLDEVLHGSTRTIRLQRTDPRTGQSTTQTLRVKIPPGVREAQLIRLAGKGQEGIGGGDSGNLYLRVKFAQHPDFRVRGADLYYDLESGPVGSGAGRHRPHPNSGWNGVLENSGGHRGGTAISFTREGFAHGRRNAGRPVCRRVHPGPVASYAGTKSPVGAVGRKIDVQPEENLMSKRSDPDSSISLCAGVVSAEAKRSCTASMRPLISRVSPAVPF